MATTLRWNSARAARHAPVWIGMAAVVAVCWVYLMWMDRHMAAMDGNGMAPMATTMHSEGWTHFLPTLWMWAVMMLAMMLPSVVPSTVLFSNLTARRHATHSNLASLMYVLGYAACWILFAVPAAALQTVLTNTSLLDATARSTSPLLSAALLLAAGLYQFSPLKTACLSKCHSPLGFFMAKWRDGTGGALALGVQHGGYCVGCCWALMAVMLVVGTMHLVWMGALTLLLLSEKVVPPAWQINRITGGVLVGYGLWLGVGLGVGG